MTSFTSLKKCHGLIFSKKDQIKSFIHSMQDNFLKTNYVFCRWKKYSCSCSKYKSEKKTANITTRYMYNPQLLVLDPFRLFCWQNSKTLIWGNLMITVRNNYWQQWIFDCVHESLWVVVCVVTLKKMWLVLSFVKIQKSSLELLFGNFCNDMQYIELKIPHTGNTRPSRQCVIQKYRYYTMSLSQ